MVRSEDILNLIEACIKYEVKGSQCCPPMISGKFFKQVPRFRKKKGRQRRRLGRSCLSIGKGPRDGHIETLLK